MSLDMARLVADAVLFEGYLLYPYRASALKNQMRWQFGVLAPPATPDPSENRYSQTECLLDANADSVVDIQVRFLQLRSQGPESADEGVVREVTVSARLDEHGEFPFELPGAARVETDMPVTSWSVSGVIRVEVASSDAGLRKLRVVVENHTPWEPAEDATRVEMLRRSLVSTHLVLSVNSGSFVSLLDPPEMATEAVRSCQNHHTWPVLIGNRDERTVMLSSPIILYDYPEVAAESPGDLFDSGEIDEILTLRTMTLTESEKAEARATDPRAARIIDRSESMSDTVRDRLHGRARTVSERPQ